MLTFQLFHEYNLLFSLLITFLLSCDAQWQALHSCWLRLSLHLSFSVFLSFFRSISIPVFSVISSSVKVSVPLVIAPQFFSVSQAIFLWSVRWWLLFLLRLLLSFVLLFHLIIWFSLVFLFPLIYPSFSLGFCTLPTNFVWVLIASLLW